MLDIKLSVVHPDQAACDAFRSRFRGLARFDAVCGRYADLPPHDAFVTAGNAYGIMTAGIDAAVVDFHGEALMTAVQDRIRNDYLGEQPVGSAFVVPTGAPDRPFLVHAPTMRMPGGISGSDHVYTATWAGLLAVYRHNVTAERPIRTVFAPAMGTGFGAMPFDESARQMAAAWRHFLHPGFRLDWDQAIARERAITTDAGRVVARQQRDEVRESMATDPAGVTFPSGADFAWLACDAAGHVAVFTNAGVGPIPSASLALGELAESAEEHVDQLPVVGACVLLVKMPRPDDYLAFAERGLFAYDWTDVHRRTGRSHQYELVARPEVSAELGRVSEPVRRLASAVRFVGTNFADSPRLPPAGLVPCVSEAPP